MNDQEIESRRARVQADEMHDERRGTAMKLFLVHT